MFVTSFFRKYRGSSTYYIMNVAGLSLATAIMLLTGLYVYRELTTNMYHKNIRNIYAVSLDGRSTTPYFYGEALMRQLPGIDSYTRVQLWDLKSNVLRHADDPPIDLDGIIRADTNFFDFFSFVFKQGNPSSCLSAPESLVLTESSARKIFGNSDPLGKLISYNKGQILCTVTGIIEDPPPNSSLKFNAVMSVRSLPKIYPPFANAGPFFWSFDTFISLKGTIADDKLDSTASDIFRQVMPVESIKEARDLFKSKFEIRLIPYKKIYFSTGFQTSLNKGNIRTVFLFSLIGMLVMLVAIINFINLSNAASTLRFKETVIKKILGANRGTMFLKCILESILLCFVSVVTGMILAKIVLAEINSQQLFSTPLEFFGIREIIFILSGSCLLLGLIAGAYPAAVLASLRPSVTSSYNNTMRAAGVRKILLVFQFFISSGLIITTLVITRQYRCITQNSPGFSAENVLCLRMSGALKKNYVPFVNRLSENANIERSARARYGFIGGRGPASIELVHRGDKMKIDAIQFTTDTGFMEILGIQLTRGNSLKEHDNITHKLIINEKALKDMNFSGDPNEIIVPDPYHNTEWRVVGVMNDFNTRSMQMPIAPCLFYFVPGDPDMDGFYIRLKEGTLSNYLLRENTISFIKKACSEFSPDEPVSIEFMENSRDMLYREDDTRRKLFLFFSGFSLMISCLGLYSLAGFILARRTREIGIRKVYGAGERSILYLLSSDFLRLVITGFIFALPVSWYLMSRWLQNFAVKTGLSWWIFALAGLMILAISIITISFEIRKASRSNPADIIKHE